MAPCRQTYHTVPTISGKAMAGKPADLSDGGRHALLCLVSGSYSFLLNTYFIPILIP